MKDSLFVLFSHITGRTLVSLRFLQVCDLVQFRYLLQPDFGLCRRAAEATVIYGLYVLIFGLPQMLIIPSGFRRSQTLRKCGHTLLITCFFY